MFENAKQLLFKAFNNENKSLVFLTNEDLKEDFTIDQSVLNIGYSPGKADMEQVLLRLNALNATKKKDKQVFIISDFQDLKDPNIFLKDTNTLFHLDTLRAKNPGKF
ncbi:MAG: hypothetical protein U5K51_03045 [Flavobacteriaceae bacterium]|nr:hypothetical protein [Flavobacteriaceae bacterium]